jgi:nickel superoxide dismutase
MLITKVLNLLPHSLAYAHCDIPCGIYDPYPAQIAAHTVLRMTQLIKSEKDTHNIARLAKVKEEHAEIVKHEVGIIWGDYFKEENMKEIDNLHELVFHLMKLASGVKQEVDEDKAKNLLIKVQEFSEIFYKSKGLKPVRIPSGYPTNDEIISHE